MKSIGQILKAARLKKNYTIEDVNKFVKVHPKYIKAMEANDYSIFDGKVHSKGFLKIYVQFLELDLDELLALWRREYEAAFDKEKDFKLSKIKVLEPEKFIITPSTLIIAFVGTLLLGFFMYLFFQYRQYTDAPTLDIYYPEDNIVVVKDILDITGKVELDSEVFINNQKIIANTDGSFLTSIKLREGINTISIKSVNKLNKETETIRNIIFRPEEIIEEVIVPDTTIDTVEVEVIEE
ncbi:helix-turn-helix domain-containing protein [Patescibacteria group bacterium]